MSVSLRLSLLLFCAFSFVGVSAQITPNTCAAGTTFKNFSNYTEDSNGSNTGTAELSGTCATASWSHNGVVRGEEYAGDVRFKTSNGEELTYTVNFSETLVNPVVYIGAVESPNVVTIMDCNGTVVASQTQLAGGNLVASGTGWTGTGPSSMTSGSFELTGSYSCLQINIVNTGTDDGIDIDFGACVADAPTAPMPTYVDPVACLPNHLIYTVNHADAITGTLHGGINVTTEITGTRSGSIDTEGIGSIGPVDPNVPAMITSGGLLQFKMTNDGDDFAVKYTFSAPVRNSFIYVGTTGPETATIYKVYELDGVTPIPVGLIDGQPGFIASGNQIGTNKNNVEGYVQIQDNVARPGFVIQVINDVDPPCFVGTADSDEGGFDAFRLAVGACRPDEMSIGSVTATITDQEITIGEPFSVSVAGLTNMKQSINGQRDFGLNVYCYPEGKTVADYSYPPSNAITLAQAGAMPVGTAITVPVLVGQITHQQLTNNCTEGTLSNIILPASMNNINYSKVITLDAMPVGYPATSFMIPGAADVIPTMGEWGIIILTICMMILGLVTIREQKLVPTTA